MAYDDEGCFLWSLTSYCSEGGLYDRVESWYGPFFFTFNHLLHVLAGLNFNHDTGRLLTLLYWCGTVLVCGLICWKQTRSLCAGLAGTVLTFVCLITVIREPMHPSGFLTLAAALAVLAGGAALVRGRPVAFAGAVALLGMAMVLSKINVGAFFLIATGTWLAINSRAAAHTRAATLLTALACAAVPLLLMRVQWPSPWATAVPPATWRTLRRKPEKEGATVNLPGPGRRGSRPPRPQRWGIPRSGRAGAGRRGRCALSGRSHGPGPRHRRIAR